MNFLKILSETGLKLKNYAKSGKNVPIVKCITACLLDILIHFLAIVFLFDKGKHEEDILFRYVVRFPELLFKIIAQFFDVHH